jgi:hypothetical protein
MTSIVSEQLGLSSVHCPHETNRIPPGARQRLCGGGHFHHALLHRNALVLAVAAICCRKMLGEPSAMVDLARKHVLHDEFRFFITVARGRGASCGLAWRSAGGPAASVASRVANSRDTLKCSRRYS